MVAPARQPLQQRVAAVILEAAARTLARRPDASMIEVAAEAGVARATLYRYFPSRQALLEELVDGARDHAVAALDEARVGQVAPRAAVTRAVRALLEIGPATVVLIREGAGGGAGDAVAEQVRALVRRGQEQGAIRADVPDAWLTDSLLALVASVGGGPGALGRDDTVAAVASLFLDGAGARAGADAATAPTSGGPTTLQHERG